MVIFCVFACQNRDFWLAILLECVCDLLFLKKLLENQKKTNNVFLYFNVHILAQSGYKAFVNSIFEFWSFALCVHKANTAPACMCVGM